MRNQKQVAVRKKGVEIANELMLWMKTSGQIKGFRSSGGEGSNYPDLQQFHLEKGYDSHGIWRGWYILKEAGKVI